MSTESEENGVHIGSVDVSETVKENAILVGENICDSGIDTLDTSSAAFPASDSDISPIKNITSDDLGHGSSTGSLSNESSLSSPGSEDGGTDNLNFEFPQQTDADFAKELIINCIDNMALGEKQEQCKEHLEINDLKQNECYDSSNKNLTTSTVSLNDNQCTDNVICKSPFSKSAENITNVTFDKQNETTGLNSSDKELNADKILSQFSSQKTKASAVQKIPETVTNVDPKYTRIPKELLSQDIGSIVKNVHGIFSSVSGSLKSAYTHRTAYAQKPTKPTKNLPNGKLMNDIFEDENTDMKTDIVEKPETIECKENIPYSNSNTDSMLKPLDSDSSDSTDTKKDVLRLQVESLERVLAEQRKENASLRERVKQQCDELQQKDMTFKELEVKLDMVSESYCLTCNVCTLRIKVTETNTTSCGK